ncbi:hypothetical protein N9L47_03785 [Rhodobacteraceae bacterium]|nr:hypothetical protein [Paracoccaceae bacterium]
MSFLRPTTPDGPQNSERLGKPSQDRPTGCLIWLATKNAADAGGVLSLVKELSYLREEPVHCLVTTDTDAPFIPSVARGVIHQFTPVETQGSIARFLDHWQPNIGIFLGDVDAPKLVDAAAARGVPFFMTAIERGGMRNFPAYLSKFRTCLAASAADALVLRKQLKSAGTDVEITGPFVDTVHVLPCDDVECDALAKLLGGRPVWLAADVQPGEIPLVEAAHRRAFRAAHRLLLILVPTDLDQVAEMRAGLDANGWRTALRSEGDEPDPDIQIYIADIEDELGLWYRLAPTSFLGGSFTPEAEGADPYAAAALGSAILHGVHVGDAEPRFRRLALAGGCLEVHDGDSLGEAVHSLLAPDRAAALAQAGWSVTTESAAVVERLVALIDLALEQAGDA